MKMGSEPQVQRRRQSLLIVRVWCDGRDARDAEKRRNRFPCGCDAPPA